MDQTLPCADVCKQRWGHQIEKGITAPAASPLAREFAAAVLVARAAEAAAEAAADAYADPALQKHNKCKLIRV